MSIVLLVLWSSATAQIDSAGLRLYQRALELNNPLTVLTVTMRPGEEDLATLAYLRQGLGARTMNVYVTNGESGEQDGGWEYSPFLAARRREAAAEAMRALEAEAYFLGMPDILPDDTVRSQGRWSGDTLVARFTRVVSQFRPDVVILFRDQEMGVTSPVHDSVRTGLLRIVRLLADPTPSVAAASRARFDKWTVLRVFDEGNGPLTLPLGKNHPMLRKNYVAIGRDLGNEYGFMQARRAVWVREGKFARIHPDGGKGDRDLDPGRLGVVPAKYAGISAQLSNIAGAMRKRPKNRDVLLREIVAAIDSIEKAMRYVLEISLRDRRLLVQWKVRLEEARIAVLGISVRYAWTETVLTEHQLTYFRVDTILNRPPGGTTELYVPAVQSGWGLDEDVVAWLPLEYGREYRILSPGSLPLNMPHWEEGLPRFGVGNPFLVAIVHRGKTREQSFMYRITTRFSYAKRFTNEFLTPLLRVLPEERFVVRLTNHSRDGVRDRLVVGDSVVFRPSTMEFALSRKEATVTDTLLLRGLPAALPYGNYLVPVKIGSVPVGEIGARHFEASVDSARRVFVVTDRQDPPVWQTLRRLGLTARRLLRESALDSLEADSCDVVIVDRNVLLTMPGLREKKQALQRFVAAGGHLVLLAQDAIAWDRGPLVDGLHLVPALAGWRLLKLQPDSTRFPFAGPNIIGEDLTRGWSHRTFYNEITATAGSVSLLSPGGTPLIVTGNLGNGRWTYIDLALDAQWMNIDPAAFRLLANVVSAR